MWTVLDWLAANWIGVTLIAVLVCAVGWYLWFDRSQARRLDGVEWDEDWQREPVTVEDADQLIADLRDDPRMFRDCTFGSGSDYDIRVSSTWPHAHLEPWHERGWWDDPDLTVWDAKQQAARCWEILHIEFPRLRAELGIAA